MEFQYELGQAVRVTRNVRNDGTYPGKEIGDMLIRRGCIGHVMNVGTFLQDQIIYSVHFVEDGIVVGCRQEELIDGDMPWIPSKYEFRDKVTTRSALAIKGEVLVNPGDQGEILKVLADEEGGFNYHVRFPGRTLLVPENILDPVGESSSE